MERKNILLIKTASRYASSERYIEEWALAMRKLGCNTCTLDGWSLAQPMLYNHVLAKYKFDVVLDLNGVCCDWGITRNLSTESIYGIYLCDPPVGVGAHLNQADDRTIVFGCDRNFCDYIDKFFPMVKHTSFIPLSGSARPEYIPYEKRTLDIIFTGTWQDPEQIKKELSERFGQGGVLLKFLEDMLEDIIVNSQYTLEECLSRTLKKYNQEVSDADFHELMGEFFKVDFYARFYYRDKVIRALLDDGLTIHVFGQGWENFYSEHMENLVIHEGGAYAAEKALADARIALNIMPWFKDAFQERIAAAMLSKAVAVTDESKYTVENFRDNEELIIFSLKDVESLSGRLKYLLSHQEEAAEIAENGYKKVQNHTWYNRAYDMLRKMEEEFGISLLQEGEGKRLEFDLEYPDAQSVRLDAVYELYKMADLADHDAGKIERLTEGDMNFLAGKFEVFNRQFGSRLEGMDLSDVVRNHMSDSDHGNLKEAVELFSMQCKALAGKLLLEEKGLRI